MECPQPQAQQHGLAAAGCTAAVSEAGLAYCRDCTVVDVEMEVGGDTSSSQSGREAAEPGHQDNAQLPFSKELITFSLFGKIPARQSKLRYSVC